MTHSPPLARPRLSRRSLIALAAVAAALITRQRAGAATPPSGPLTDWTARDLAMAYNASKAAVWMLSKSVALYCAKRGWNIRSNSIHPTFVDTPILDGIGANAGLTKEVVMGKLARQIPLGRVGAPQEIANGVLYLASDESSFMTGAELKLDGGISAM